MGQAMRLVDVIDKLAEFDSEDTIYALEPWTAESEAVVAREPAQGGLPPDALEAGMKYFLEISIAKDFAEDWRNSSDGHPNAWSVCQRVIEYAINDA